MVNPDGKIEYVFDGTFKTTDIARYCGVSVVHVNRWIKQGKLKAYRYPRGKYKITEKDFREFLDKNNIPIIKSFFSKKDNKKIIIGEDNKDFAQVLKKLIEDQIPNVEIEIAHDGFEVLFRIGDIKPDLLILDIRMPNLDGLEVCSQIKSTSELAKTRIIAMTAHESVYKEEMVLKKGADAFLVKPFKGSQLLKKIKEILDV